MQRKWIGLALTAMAALLVVPAVGSQNGYWYSVGDDGEDGRVAGYTLFNVGEGAFLGVTMEEEVDHEEGGARITSVVGGSPADEAGLEEGDIVVGFEKDTIRGPVSLTRKIRARESGDTVEITVLRDGRRRSFEIELGERSHGGGVFGVAPRVLERLENLEIPEFDFENLEGLEKLKELEGMNFNFDFGELEEQLGKTLTLDCEDGDCTSHNYFFRSSKPRLGVQLTETTPELRQHLGGSEDAGVLVGKVIEDSAAEDAGIEVGDLIVSVGGDAIANTNDLRKALGRRVGEAFDVEVIRDGRSMSLSVSLEEEAEEERPSGPRASIQPRAPRFAPRASLAPKPALAMVRPTYPEKMVMPAPQAMPAASTAPVLAAPRAMPAAPTAPVLAAPRAKPAPPVAPVFPAPRVPFARPYDDVI